jgi:hypothetical protein
VTNHGEVLVFNEEDNHETWIRGHVTDEEAREIVTDYDPDYELDPEVATVRTYGHRGFGVDEEGDCRGGYIYLRNKRGPGWFPVTVVEVRERQ